MHNQARLYLSASGPAEGTPPFRFSGLDAARSTVALYSIADGPMQVAGSCDGAVQVRHDTDADASLKGFAAGEAFR